MATEIEYLDRLSVLEKKKAVLRAALTDIMLEETKIRKEMTEKFENPTRFIGKKFNINNETCQVTNVDCLPHTGGRYTVSYKRILKKDGVSLSMRCFTMDFQTFVNRMRFESDPSRKIVLL